MVLAGWAERILIPALPKAPDTKLRGVRLLHTHLTPQPLSQEDLMDLVFLRFDQIAVLTVSQAGTPETLQFAELSPSSTYNTSPVLPWTECSIPVVNQPQSLESAFDSKTTLTNQATPVILVAVADQPKLLLEKNLEELAKLATTAGLSVAATLLQTRPVNAQSILGKGKMAELEVLALQHNAETLVFDGELTPTQLRNLAELTERKVLDRTQLILDIFAQHAHTKTGKLQVELAQLKYLESRLTGQHKALDRLMGGIGGRGPGESKLETDRRKNRARQAFLTNELDKLSKQRATLRAR
ncbi:MAG: GTPase HflX, partial [Desulfovibrio sp.]|nr:GTPase HflX [Desulfovibrio sp.]